MLGRTDSRLRLVALLSIFALIASLLGLRLAYWQIGQADWLRGLAATQVLTDNQELAIERGQILDRSGNVLATTAYRDLLAAWPDLMSAEQRETVPKRLAEILGLTAQEEAEDDPRPPAPGSPSTPTAPLHSRFARRTRPPSPSAAISARARWR